MDTITVPITVFIRIHAVFLHLFETVDWMTGRKISCSSNPQGFFHGTPIRNPARPGVISGQKRRINKRRKY